MVKGVEVVQHTPCWRTVIWIMFSTFLILSGVASRRRHRCVSIHRGTRAAFSLFGGTRWTTCPRDELPLLLRCTLQPRRQAQLLAGALLH